MSMQAFGPQAPGAAWVAGEMRRQLVVDLETRAEYERVRQRLQRERRTWLYSRLAAWYEIPTTGLLRAVVDLHAPASASSGRFLCDSCRDDYGDYSSWPCATADLILEKMGAM